MGRVNRWMSETAEIAVAQIVAEDEDKVWFGREWLGKAKERQENPMGKMGRFHIPVLEETRGVDKECLTICRD